MPRQRLKATLRAKVVEYPTLWAMELTVSSVSRSRWPRGQKGRARLVDTARTRVEGRLALPFRAATRVSWAPLAKRRDHCGLMIVRVNTAPCARIPSSRSPTWRHRRSNIGLGVSAMASSRADGLSCPMTEHPILITGGTGKVGGRAVARLGAKGVAVRVGSRSGDPRFEWTDRSTWDAALDGVKKIFLVPQDGERLSQPFVRRARELGVERVVRPAWFAQNLSEGFFRDAVLGGELRLPAGDGAASFVDAEDSTSSGTATCMTKANGRSRLFGPGIRSGRRTAFRSWPGNRRVMFPSLRAPRGRRPL